MSASDSAKFEGILDRYFETSLAHSPIFANYVGWKEGEGKLDKVTVEAEVTQEKLRRKTLSALEAVSPQQLSSEQHLDRLALYSQLRHECEDFERKTHTMDPGAVDNILRLLLHELQRGEDKPERAAQNIRSLLKQIPSYFSDATSLCKHPERVWRKTMEEAAEGAESLFDAVATFLKRNGNLPSDAQRIKSANKSLETYRDKIRRMPLAPAHSYAVGSEILARRVRDDLGLDYSLSQIEALAYSEIERVSFQLKKACAKFGRNRDPHEIISEARSHWKPKDDLLSLYQNETVSMAKAFRGARAVSFPRNDQLDVRPVPDFMRPFFPTAAYSSPGAFEKISAGFSG
jgi:uncharacterized protein (DUF885 family)